MGEILIKTDGDIEKKSEIVDVVQATEEKVQMVASDKSSELVSGWIFGGYGDFKIWVEVDRSGDVEKYRSTDPLTMPNGMVVVKDKEQYKRSGRIARLKVIDNSENK